MKNDGNYIKPTTMTVITTYQCTSACKECCFECNPYVKGKLSFNDISSFIQETYDYYHETLKLCVFTGGECTLLGNDLLNSISYAHNLGLLTRIVSNGWWGKTSNTAFNYVKKLICSGLDEINLSTGDDHQEWVPFSNIKNILIAAYRQKISIVINVETREDSKFNWTSLFLDEELRKIIKKDNGKLIKIVNGVWIPFRKGSVIKQSETTVKKINELKQTSGCDSILNFIGLNPYKELVSCCGLSMEYIDSMKLGKYETGNLNNLFLSQFNDFMKIWIWVDGPEKIAYYAYKKDPSLRDIISNIAHPCEACSLIYNNMAIKKILLNNYKDVMDSVMLKYKIKLCQNDQSILNNIAEGRELNEIFKT